MDINTIKRFLLKLHKNIIPPILNQPLYKLPLPYFFKKVSFPPIRPYLKIPPFLRGVCVWVCVCVCVCVCVLCVCVCVGGDTNSGFIYRNIYPPLHFILILSPPLLSDIYSVVNLRFFLSVKCLKINLLLCLQ